MGMLPSFSEKEKAHYEPESAVDILSTGIAEIVGIPEQVGSGLETNLPQPESAFLGIGHKDLMVPEKPVAIHQIGILERSCPCLVRGEDTGGPSHIDILVGDVISLYAAMDNQSLIKNPPVFTLLPLQERTEGRMDAVISVNRHQVDRIVPAGQKAAMGDLSSAIPVPQALVPCLIHRIRTCMEKEARIVRERRSGFIMTYDMDLDIRIIL